MSRETGNEVEASGRTESGPADDQEVNELEVLSNQFSARVEGLRELVEVISPHVAALDEPEGIEVAMEKSGLSDQGKAVIKGMLLPGSGEDDDGNEVADAESSGLEPWEQLAQEFTEVARTEPAGLAKVLRRFTQRAIAPSASLLHGSLLTVAVASFEFLLAGLYGQHLIQFPKQLDGDEKEFSLADLVEIGSIEEAQRVLAERRVDSFMRRGIDDWSRWSQKTLGHAFDDLCPDFPHFNEVFQRRHAIVHTGGIVNRLYLERVGSLGETLPALGEELQISSSYIESALDELEVLGHSLAALAQAKWDPEHADNASRFLNTRIYDMLQGGRFELARKLAAVGETLGQSGSWRWMITVNGWIASKRLGEFDQCKPAIADWDVSALSKDFKLAKACLLEEWDEAFTFLAAVIQESPDRSGVVWDWPLLDDLRTDPRFEQTFVNAGFTPPNQIVRSEP